MISSKIMTWMVFSLLMSLRVLASEEPEDTTKIYRLKEVVVTATRSEKNPQEIGRSVTLITSEQLGKSFVSNISELLSQQEGIYGVGAGQNPGMLQSIFMRGANNSHTTVMVDDIRISDPSGVNNALDLSELSLANLEQVEIVRGSHSTLYGSSAIGGVVNLITKKNKKPGFNGNANVTAGSFGEGTLEFSQNAFLNYSAESGLYVSGEIYNSNIKGLDATIDTVTDPNIFKRRDKDGFVHIDLIGKIGFVNDRWDIYGSFKRTKQKTDIDKTAYRDDDNYTLDFQRNLFTYGASYRVLDNLHLRYLGGYSTMERIAIDDSSVIDQQGNTDQTYSNNRWKGSTSTNEVQANLKLNGFEGVVGVGLYRETMGIKTYFYSGGFGGFELKSDLDTLNLNTTTGNIFAHVDFNGSLIDQNLDWISFAVGGRLYHHSTFGSKLTYAVNPSLKASENTLIYGSYSSGFNAPSLYQLYTPEKDFVSGVTRGNRNLKPEISSSFEIGIKQVVNNRLSFGASYFHTTVENVIEYVYLWDQNIGIDTLSFNDYRGDTYLNLGTQTSRGVEFSFHSKISEQLEFSGNFSLVSGKLRYKPSDVDVSHTQSNHVQIFDNGAFINKEVESLGLVRRPNTVNVSLTYKPIERLALRIDARHVGARSDIFYSSVLGPFGALGTVPVADYTLVDFSQRFTLDEHVSISAKIENVLNTKYAEINGFTTRGRGVYLRARYSL